MRLGADVDALEGVGRLMAACSRRIDLLRGDLDASAAAPGWRGPDADRFRDQWQRELGPAMRRVATGLSTGSESVTRDAAQQREVAAPSSVDPVAVLDAGGPVIDPAPRRVRIVTATLEAPLAGVAGGALTAGLGLTMRVEDLGDSTSRIVELDTAKVTAAGGTGATVEVGTGDDEISGGAGANVEMGLTVGPERTWVVPTDEVDEFMMSRLLDPGGDEGRTIQGDVLAAIPGAAAVSGMLGLGTAYDVVTYDRPAPQRTGVVAGVGAEAEAVAGVGEGRSVEAMLSSDSVIGVSRDRTDGSTYVALSSALTASLAVPAALTAVVPSGGTGEASVTLRLDRNGAPVSLETVRFEREPGRVAEHRMSIDLTAVDLDRPAARLVGALGGDGDARAALDEVLTNAVGHATYRSDVYDLAGHSVHGIDSPAGTALLSTEEWRLER